MLYMTLINDFNQYCRESFDDYDLVDIYNRIKTTGEYCSSTLRELISTVIYIESHKKNNENLPKLSHYLNILSDKETQGNITIVSLLYIISLCEKIRDGTKSPNTHSTLYI
jgi:hypothetical protein